MIGKPVYVATLLLGTGIVLASPAFAQQSNPPTASSTSHRAAEDKFEIMEMSAHFDNALDAEDIGKFTGVFTPDGTLSGFWGDSSGTEGIRKAFAFMLATFSKNRRHVVTNHEISVSGDHATMFCYLTVFDRESLAVTGTATFTDELVRTSQGWRFIRRTLKADPNVDPIIESLKNGSQTR